MRLARGETSAARTPSMHATPASRSIPPDAPKEPVEQSDPGERRQRTDGAPDDSRRVLATLQPDYAQRYGVASLKIRHHAQLGYVLEAPSSAVEKLRVHTDLTLRQSMTNGARFTTPELAPTAIGVMNAGSAIGGAGLPWVAGAIAQATGIWTLMPYTAALAVVLIAVWRPLAARIGVVPAGPGTGPADPVGELIKSPPG